MPRDRTQPPVVAGIDGSDISVRAARIAAEAARRRGAPLHLLHASLDVSDLLGTRADLTLRTVAESLMRQDDDVVVSWSITEGSPLDALRSLSAEAQLVIVGGQGAGGTNSPRVGSTANGVAASAHCPVVVVPDNTTSIVVRGRRSVVVGVEGHRSADAVLAFAFQEAATRRTDLVAVHTWRDVTPAQYESDGPMIDWAAVRVDEERVLTETLAGWQEKWPDVVVREVIARGKAARSLLAVGLMAELLVIGHRRRGPLATMRSTTRAILRRATGPVAVVPIDPRPGAAGDE